MDIDARHRALVAFIEGRDAALHGVAPIHAAPAGGPERFAALIRTDPQMVRTPDFDVDLLDRCVRFPDGEEVRCTPRQWRLLESLIRWSGHPVSARQLAHEVFGEDAADEAQHLPVLIVQLRRKFEPEPHVPRYLRSLDAEAYLFDPECGLQPPTVESPRYR